jgi:hypothetical protein
VLLVISAVANDTFHSLWSFVLYVIFWLSHAQMLFSRICCTVYDTFHFYLGTCWRPLTGMLVLIQHTVVPTTHWPLMNLRNPSIQNSTHFRSRWRALEYNTNLTAFFLSLSSTMNLYFKVCKYLHCLHITWVLLEFKSKTRGVYTLRNFVWCCWK